MVSEHLHLAVADFRAVGRPRLLNEALRDQLGFGAQSQRSALDALGETEVGGQAIESHVHLTADPDRVRVDRPLHAEPVKRRMLQLDVGGALLAEPVVPHIDELDGGQLPIPLAGLAEAPTVSPESPRPERVLSLGGVVEGDADVRAVSGGLDAE